MVRNNDNRNLRSKHRYTVNQTECHSVGFFTIGLSRTPTEIGQLERNHRNSVPWIHPCALTPRGIIPHVGKLAIRNVCQTPVIFHPHSWPSPTLLRRAGDTIRSALGESGAQLFPSRGPLNPGGRHPIGHITIPCSDNSFHRGLDTHPFED
jgi:hypothetical protein